MTPGLTLPTPVHSRKFNTASTNLSPDKSFLAEYCPARPPSCPSRSKNPCVLCIFLPQKCPRSNQKFPTSVHSFLISSFHILHSLKRCSLVCLPLPHHQHPSDSTQPNFSFKKGAIIACPEESWKREASSFGARCRPGGILGRSPSAGTKRGVFSLATVSSKKNQNSSGKGARIRVINSVSFLFDNIIAPGKGNKRTQHLRVAREAEEISLGRFWRAMHENCEYTWDALDSAIKRYKLAIEAGEVYGINVLYLMVCWQKYQHDVAGAKSSRVKIAYPRL